MRSCACVNACVCVCLNVRVCVREFVRVNGRVLEDVYVRKCVYVRA